MTAAYDVPCDDVQRAAYERDLADVGANGPLEIDFDEHGVEWVLLSALRLEEESNRQNVHQFNEEHAKVLEEESSVTDEMLEKKNEQLQKKKQELEPPWQELETLFSQKQLDDVIVQYERLNSEVGAACAAQEINDLDALLEARLAKHVEDVAC